MATSNVNSKIRNRYSSEQINIDDGQLKTEQQEIREKNHQSNNDEVRPSSQQINVGDIVYLIDEKHKFKARERYIVVSLSGEYAHIQKLSDKFMSVKYKVNVKQLYRAGSQHTMETESYQPRPLDSSSDSEEELTFPCRNQDSSLQPEGSVQDPGNLSTEGSAMRRSGRPKKAPSWMLSDEWEV